MLDGQGKSINYPHYMPILKSFVIYFLKFP